MLRRAQTPAAVARSALATRRPRSAASPPLLLRTLSVNASQQSRAPATAAMAAPSSSVRAAEHDSTAETSQREKTLSFRETQQIFKHKTTGELLRAYAVFGVSQLQWIVRHSDRLLKAAYVFPGETATNALLRASFFGHFCAGENANEIKPVLEKLDHAGIGGILDYAAEADVEHPRDLSGVSQNLVSARTYDYEDESTCDANAAIARQAIIDAGTTKAPGEPAFAAIKCTALGKPELLMRMSSIIVQAHLLFTTLDGPNLSRAKSQYLKKLVDYPALSAGLRNAGVDMADGDIASLFEAMDVSQDGVIDYVDWVSYLDPMDLTMGPLTQFIAEQPLDDREKTQLRNMIHRLESLASEAAEMGVKLMVDAEQTYMQPGIDHLVLNLQRKYNRDKKDVIYNTFQCYLKISGDRIDIDLERARREQFQFACKLVRGAYMVQERKRAKDRGYSDPIHDGIDATHANYDAQVEKLLRNNAIASFMVASHNEDSVKKTVRLMDELAIDRRRGGVYFGQLLGMCDNVSYTLGAHAYRVFKYVPYGPIKEVLPYLVRRAQENSGLMSNATKEMDLIKQEVVRRVVGGGRSP
jgi:proline dehydrogenase